MKYLKHKIDVVEQNVGLSTGIRKILLIWKKLKIGQFMTEILFWPNFASFRKNWTGFGFGKSESLLNSDHFNHLKFSDIPNG